VTVIDQALSMMGGCGPDFAGDEHAIKFTEACLREYALNPDPDLLAGPLDMSGRHGRQVRGQSA
jgi:hypothetical protein